MTSRCRTRRGLLAAMSVLLLVATPTAAQGQFGWVKKLLGRKPSVTAIKDAAKSPDSSASKSTSSQGGGTGETATHGGAAGATQAANTPSVPAVDVAAQTAERQRKEMEDRLAYGRILDQRPRTLQSARDRVDFWGPLKETPPFNAEAHRAYEAARTDLEASMQTDSTQKASSESVAKLDKKARSAENALRGRNFSDAISIADEILTDDPDNASAKRVKQLAESGEKARRLKVTLFALGAAALAIFVLFGVFAKKIFKKEDSGQAAPAPVGAAVGKGVYVQVVDGVGRGKLARVQGEVFRIGASEGADDSERNDLVISDSLASVSRHHCSIIKKGRDYYLIDSSRNGTRLNTRVLARGDDRRLRDGDEISLADVSILKFVKT